jgi:hypothetical protein
MRRPVTIAKYLDVTEAQLARVRLGGEGIEAFVIEAAGFNPLLSGASGGVQLQVRERDIDRARAVLAEVLADVEEQDDLEVAPGAERVVRCPRCELEYCYHERARGSGHALNPLVIVGQVFATSMSAKRWRCRKCEHVWDDADEGPKKMTRLEAGDPKPVFRLRRGRGGMGVFLGFMIGVLLAMIASGLLKAIPEDARQIMGVVMLLVLVGAPVLGWLIGKGVRADVCSVPECRTPLPRDAEECPGCKGTLAGSITSAPEHYSAAADVRRELAAARKAELPAKKKKKKQPIEPAAPAP